MQFVSVIIPVYNDENRIQLALKALLQQTYPKNRYEVIVVDNGSNDKTVSVIKYFCSQFPKIIRLVFENSTQSSYAARNRGIAEAQGTLLAFTDSDCIPDRKWIEAGNYTLSKYNSKCGGGKIIFFYQNEKPNFYEHYDSARKLKQREFVEKSGFAATANMFASADLFDRHGLFRNDLISGGDYEFGQRLVSANEKLIYMPEAIVKHPARHTFKSIQKKAIRVAKGQKQLKTLGIYKHDNLSVRQLDTR